MNRREFLRSAALTSLSFMVPGVRGWAYSNGTDDVDRKKLIVILLRGGVDGLNVVAPYGDSLYYSIRPTIALPRPGSATGALNLDGHFGLHPALSPLMPYWNSKQLAFVHSSGSRLHGKRYSRKKTHWKWLDEPPGNTAPKQALACTSN